MPTPIVIRFLYQNSEGRAWLEIFVLPEIQPHIQELQGHSTLYTSSFIAEQNSNSSYKRQPQGSDQKLFSSILSNQHCWPFFYES